MPTYPNGRLDRTPRLGQMSSGGRGGQAVADLICAQWSAGRTAGQFSRNRLLHPTGRLGVAEVVEHHRDGEYRRDGIRHILARDVRGGSVDGFKHGRECALRVDAPAGGKPDTAGDRGGDVGEDVT